MQDEGSDECEANTVRARQRQRQRERERERGIHILGLNHHVKNHSKVHRDTHTLKHIKLSQSHLRNAISSSFSLMQKKRRDKGRDGEESVKLWVIIKQCTHRYELI